MTVVRGDAARRLMARHRTTAAHLPPAVPARAWSATWRSCHGQAASPAAAAFVARELTQHGLVERVPDATAVTQELVDNALQHGLGTVATTIIVTPDGRITLEVTDDGPTSSALTSATQRGSVDAVAAAPRGTPGQAGTGLKYIAMLSQAWGVRDSTHGKTVWAQLHDHDVRCRVCHEL